MSRTHTAEMVRSAAEQLLEAACSGPSCRPASAVGEPLDALDAGVIGIARVYERAAAAAVGCSRRRK